jgi:hypothetical protein
VIGSTSSSSSGRVSVNGWYYDWQALQPLQSASALCGAHADACSGGQISRAAAAGDARCNDMCCSGHGTCLAIDGGICECDLGYRGEHCEQQGCTSDQITSHAGIRECDTTCCSGRGRCSDAGGGMCECDLGYGPDGVGSDALTSMVMNGIARSVQVRIDDGTSTATGIRGVLMMNIDGQGWDAVCDDGFGDDEARVFCAVLGFDASEGVSSQYDTEHGDSSFAADDIQCLHGSVDISDCTTSQSPYSHNCGDSETVGLDCQVAQYCSTGVSACSAGQISRAAAAGDARCAGMCCSGHGTCLAIDGGICECDLGWHGERCEEEGCTAHQIAGSRDARCAGMCCSGHGTCSADGGGQCVCEYGYFGDHCEERGCTSEQIAAGFESDECHTMCCSAPNGACSADGSCSCALGFGPELVELGPVPLTGCPADGSLVRIIPGTRYDHGPESSNPGGVDGHITDCSSSDSLHVSWTYGRSNIYNFRDLYLVSPQGSSTFGCSEPTTTCTSRQIVSGSSTDECSAACCSGFGACGEDGICQCDSDHHGEECEFDGTSPGDPDQCPGLNLALTTSPYAGSTSSASDSFSISCGRGRDQVFFIDLPHGQRLEIGQTTNSYDSTHTTRWGGACPGDHQISCTDDPDTRRHSWTNQNGQTERVYFIVDAFGSGSGSFTLTWSVSDGSAVSSSACADICNRNSCGSDCPICAGAGYPGNGCSGCGSDVQC